jgi:hypothetical protein
MDASVAHAHHGTTKPVGFSSYWLQRRDIPARAHVPFPATPIESHSELRGPLQQAQPIGYARPCR